MRRVHIGTSGWHYDSWRSAFYPEELLVKHQLLYYASQFSSAELNGVFYRTPTVEAVGSWYAQTPDDFVFSWKASKFITHWKRLTDRCQNSLELLESRLSVLGEKAGPVLFQLPPHFPVNEERLSNFIKMLSSHRRYSFEFRDPSWYIPSVYRLLSDANCALCLSDHHDAPAPWRKTADFVYVRGHGPSGRYKGRYTKAALEAWAKKLKVWKKQGCDIYVYFDNDQKSAAPFDALVLERLI